MSSLLLLVAPIFILVFIGFMGATLKLTSERTTEGLSDFFYIFATPALLFKLIAFSAIPLELPWGYLISYYIGVVVTWIITQIIAYKVLRISYGESVIAGLSTGQCNTVMIGIPLIMSVYGEAAAAPIALLIAVNLPFTMTVATLLLEGGKAQSTGKMIKTLLLSLFTHPILLAVIAGTLWKVAGFTMPKLGHQVIDLLAAAAIPAALLALGMSLKDYGLQAKAAPLALISIGKLLIHPLITFILAYYYFNLPPIWTGSAVIFASMPAGINAFLFAKRYGEGEVLASSAVAVTTVLSLFTILGWLLVISK